MRKRSVLALLVVASALTVGIAVTTIAFGNESPSKARRVPGPTVGPSGQTGDITYLDNTGKDYSGGAAEFGPYRLIPSGTKQIVRSYPGDTEGRNFAEVKSRESLAPSRLILQPTPGWRETQFAATTRNGRPVFVTSLWETEKGQKVTVATAEVLEWVLPIDIYLGFDDSLTRKAPTTIAGLPAIVEYPNPARLGGVPPPPPGGTVRVYFVGGELILRSESLDVDQLSAMSVTVLSAALANSGGTR